MELVTAAFSVVLVLFIASTMLAAGLGTRVADLAAVLRGGTLLALALAANLVVVPLLGWGVAWLFGLSTAATIALILVASSPGAPFGAKVAMIQRGDVRTGSTIQVLLAAVGSVTFPVTANVLIGWTGVGGDLALPVADLVRSVAILQLVPFAVGLAIRHGSADTATSWAAPAQRVSSASFVAVLVLGLGSSWEQIVSLLGSRTLLAAGTFTVLAAVAGALLASGPPVRRTTLGGIAPMRNAGPAFAAVAIAFDNDPEILAASSGILLVGLVVCLPVAARLAASRSEDVGVAPDAEPLAGQVSSS
jgi:bile acid:Na+ symporter, BASS family